jgi:hypothetical protein
MINCPFAAENELLGLNRTMGKGKRLRRIQFIMGTVARSPRVKSNCFGKMDKSISLRFFI